MVWVKGIIFSPLAGGGVGGGAVVEQGELAAGGDGGALVGAGGGLHLDPDDRGGAEARVVLRPAGAARG